MRPVTNFTLHAILAAALAAFAATGAAVGDPAVKPGTVVKVSPSDSRAADQEHYFTITLQQGRASGKSDGFDKQIQVESWQWGRVAKVDSFTMKQGVKPADPGQFGEWIADVERPQAKGDVTLKGSKIGENAPRVRPSDITMKRGTSATRPVGGVRVASGDVDGSSTGASETLTVGGAQTEGQATGKRQHKPLVMQNYYDQALDEPLPSGSVRVKVKMPWLACKVGTRYPSLVLGGGAKTYRLTDAEVTNCGGDTASRPMESISFSYAKVEY